MKPVIHRRPAAASTVWLALILAPLPAPGQTVAMQPFTVSHALRQDSPADVRFLLDAPAGKDGFVRVSGGHLLKPDGTRLRLWGVNITGWNKGAAIMPPKEDAARWADTLARHGINCVRFHFLDKTTTQTPRGLIDGTRNDTRHLDPGQLDRLDYFVWELKNRGIYSNLNLNVGRTYKEGDGVPDHDLIGVAKAMTYIGDRLLELQKEYATQLLSHYNPYTKSEYRSEPAIVTVEMVNENSVLEFWFRNWLRGELVKGSPAYQLDFTPAYARMLAERYSRWLEKNLSPALLARIRKQAGLKPGEPLKPLRRGEFTEAPADRFNAEAAFYTSIERGFFLDMRKFLRETLGVKAPIVSTADHTYWIPGQPLLRSTSLMDIVDGHVYWQHPAIWGQRNTPMVNQPLASTIVKLSRSPFSGKPYTVSEVNHPNPNQYSAEMIPILASYASFQDWDGVLFYTFETKGQVDAMMPDPFDITLDPVKWPQMAAGALIFLRGDVKHANQTVERTYSKQQVVDSMRMPEAERPYFTPGFPRQTALVHGVRIRCLDCLPTARYSLALSNPIVSDTGELAWWTSGQHGGLVTVDSPRSQALIGFVKGNGKATRHLLADVKNEFCAITLSSLDAHPLARSNRMLLTAASQRLNSGAEWNDRHTLLTKLGGPPTLVEPVTGWVLFRELEGAVAVRAWALDGSGVPHGDEIRGRRLEDGWEIAIGTPVTTSYLVEVVR
jgi:hypothetical protein